MIGYALVGSNDLAKAKDFYDALCASLGAAPVAEHPSGGRIYGVSMDKPTFGVVGTFDKNPATPGNGTMISFLAANHDQVDAVHAKALELGGSDEGAPGWRGPEGGFYGAYFRDLDGNKLCVYCFGPK